MFSFLNLINNKERSHNVAPRGIGTLVYRYIGIQHLLLHSTFLSLKTQCVLSTGFWPLRHRSELWGSHQKWVLMHWDEISRYPTSAFMIYTLEHWNCFIPSPLLPQLLLSSWQWWYFFFFTLESNTDECGWEEKDSHPVKQAGAVCSGWNQK